MEPETGRRLTLQAWVTVDGARRPRARFQRTIHICTCEAGILFVIDANDPDHAVSILAPRDGSAERFVAAIVGEPCQDRLAPTG